MFGRWLRSGYIWDLRCIWNVLDLPLKCVLKFDIRQICIWYLGYMWNIMMMIYIYTFFKNIHICIYNKVFYFYVCYVLYMFEIYVKCYLKLECIWDISESWDVFGTCLRYIWYLSYSFDTYEGLNLFGICLRYTWELNVLLLYSKTYLCLKCCIWDPSFAFW